MKRWSIRGRLTVTVLVAVALALALFVLTLFWAVQRAAWLQYDNGLLARAHAFGYGAEYDEDGYELKVPPLATQSRATYLEVWLPSGDVLTRSASLGERHLFRSQKSWPDHPVFRNMALPDGRMGRAVEIRVVPRSENMPVPGQLTLMLAEGTEDVDAARANVRAWFALIGITTLLLVTCVTVWVLARGLQPLTRLAAELDHIDWRKLATRLQLEGQPAELAAPVSRLNELLARLEASFSRERQFTADVSHELRTPLAGLRTLLEVTALIDRSSTYYRTAVAEALAIVIQLGTLVQELLVLARIDNGHIEIDTSEVPLRELVDACWRSHAAAAATRSLTFTNNVHTTAIAATDREKLRIVIGNLLANAAEYTAVGGSIEVNGGVGDVMLDVINSGPPIPADQLEKIFDRLWRGDSARTSTGLHCGIGLALARSLCTCLSLTIAAANGPEGSVRFRIAKS